MSRLTIACCVAFASVCGLPTAGDTLLISVDSVPDHGAVVADVDLTAALQWKGQTNAQPERVRVREAETGAAVPAQFVPSAGFDPRTNVSGTLVMKLRSSHATRLRLDFDAPERVSTTVDNPPACVVTAAMCRAVYTAGKMGGLPHRFEFAETGKVFERFRWHDRVYDKERGSRFLFDDSEACIERLSDGPLATVVQVRARYGKKGQIARQRPEAVYQWCYLKELPLVRVTATAKQRPGKPWHEAHFLELNFSGDDFRSWAGGAPVVRGRFEGKTQSFRHNSWGALVEGRDAIGMLDCGQVLFYDHKGGSYLQAHGDRAWQMWSDAERTWSTWLWIGSGNDPVDRIRAVADALPTRSRVDVRVPELEEAIGSAVKAWRRDAHLWYRPAAARQLATCGQYALALEAATGKWPKELVKMESGLLGLLLWNRHDGVRLLSLCDIAGPGLSAPASPPLFTASLRRVGPEGETAHAVADTGWRDVRTVPTEAAGLQVRWACPVDDRLAGLVVTATVAADASVDAFVWDLQVTPPDASWALWQVRFPDLAIEEPGQAEGSVMFVPRAAGQLERNAWRRRWHFDGRYPSGWTSMPYMAAYDAETGLPGLYIGVHDPFGSTKELRAESRPELRTVEVSVDHPVPDMGKPGAPFELPGKVVWRRFKGNWFDAACIYRDWVRRKARWYPKLGQNGREDTPQWMRELSVWALGGGDPKTGLPSFRTFREKMGVPVGFHWYNWHQIPFDNDYPHYFPADDGFGDAVRALQEEQIHVMPYINGRLWDTRDRGTNDFQFTSVARPAATKNEAGEPYIEMYGSKETDGSRVQLAAMCPSTKLWQGKVGEIVLRLMNKYGVRGVYIDQVAAAKPQLCFDASHGHPLGGGHWWTESYWKMLDGIRGKMPEGRMLTTECNAEPYVKWFDGYLTWHWQYDGQVPAFVAVYGGSLQMFGRAYRGGPTKDLALRMKAGQQLVYGEQIGWINPDVVNEPENFAFLKKIVQLRVRFNRYFVAGQMGRPPKLEGSIPTVTADWQWHGVWPVTTPAVMTGAWELSAENRAVLLFVNVGDETIETSVSIDAAEYGVVGEHVRLTVFTSEGEKGSHSLRNRFRRAVSLPPRAAAAWELRP